MRNWSKYDFWAVLVALAIFVAVALTAVLSVRSDTPDALPADTEATLCERLGIVPVYNSGNFKFAMHF